MLREGWTVSHVYQGPVLLKEREGSRKGQRILRAENTRAHQQAVLEESIGCPSHPRPANTTGVYTTVLSSPGLDPGDPGTGSF